LSNIYFCTPTGRRGASTRYRVLQFLPYLESSYKIKHFAFLDDNTYEMFKSNKLFSTLLRVIFLLFRPLKLILKVKKNDILFVHRDIYPFGPFWLERCLKAKGAKIIFDLDDAIFLEDTSEITNKKNKLLYKMKYGKRYNEIIKISNIVICGNEYLANYCSKINPNTFILPTVIDSHKVNVTGNIDIISETNDSLKFGWIGNPGNSTYFQKILPIFDNMAEKYQKKIMFKCIGGNINYKPNSAYFSILEVPWSEDTEYQELSRIDIGIMPLESSEWSEGKCGFKILQYMSVAKPSIADAVGVNKNIVDHMKNGFLANSLDDWQKYIELVIVEYNSDLLNKMGKAAKDKFEMKYTLQKNLPKFKELLLKAQDNK